MNKFIENLLCNRDKKEEDVFRLQIKHYGFSNPNNILYYINENNSSLGFFAMYRYWLEYLYFADICGYIPVIDAGRDFAYCEKEPNMNKKNAFEYYFEQPMNIGINLAKRSNKVINSDIIHREMVELIFTGQKSHYKCNTRYLNAMAQIVYKYQNFNSITQSFVDKGIKQLSFDKKKILGIHIRGTDFKKKYNNHPVFVSEEDCFSAIESIFRKNGYDNIFIATDDQFILENFIQKYGNVLCYYPDVVRGSDMKSVAFHDSSRNMHKFKLGLEVIRDMYTLSMCDGLVAGISQVAICARINKLSRKEKYQDIIIIDKGIYKNGHQFYRKNK